MAGRPPKPTRIKALAGNPGRRPLPVDEPQPKQGMGAPPADLSTIAREEWDRVVTELSRIGLLAEVAFAALVMYCAWFGVATEARRDVERLSSTSAGYRRRFAVLRDASKELRAFQTQFGLTPAARPKLAGLGKAQEPTDPYAAFQQEGRAAANAGPAPLPFPVPVKVKKRK